MLKRFFLEEKNVMIVIVINAIVIFLLNFPEYRNNLFLINLDHFFILVFLVEAIVKIIALKPKNYFRDSWNVFDFIIVVMSIPAMLTYFYATPDASFFTILRLIRFVRLIRFIRFVPRMDMILDGLQRAIKASVFVLVVLIFLNFILALFTCHFYGEYAEEYFGNPLVACYSIFQMFTVEGWNEIPAVIANRMGDDRILIAAMRFYFVLVVLIGGIFGMSLANAIFVDEMTMDNNKDLEKKMDQLQQQISELKELIKKD